MKGLISFLLLFIVISLNGSGIYADEESHGNSGNGDIYHQSTFPLFMKSTANSRDIMLGFGSGVYLSRYYLLSVRPSFFLRPYEKTVFIEKSVNSYYQLKESRYGADIVLDYVFMFYNRDVSLGVYFAGGAGITVAEFDGIDIDAESMGSPVARCGLQAGATWYARMGYEYFRVPYVPSNHITFEFGVSF